MSLLRLVIAWLIMAALPLQGLAAASMLFCGQAHHSTSTQQVAQDRSSHDHSSHDHGASQHQDGHSTDAVVVDESHACPICAACCNLVALSDAPAMSPDPGPAATHPGESPTRVVTRDTPAPDKPPRG